MPQLPYAENAVVGILKLRDYCLNLEHDDEKHKARLFLSSLGMTSDYADELRQILLEIIKTGEVRLGRQDTFGQRYTLDFSLDGKTEVQPFGVDGLSSMAQRLRD